MAHVIMLTETEIIPWTSGQKLLAALMEVHAIPVSKFPFDPIFGDIYDCRELYLNKLAPDVAGWLRTGRARREATNIAYSLAMRRRLIALLKAQGQLALTIVAKAEKHLKTLMPDYTYLHQAQPTTFAHYLLGFVYPILRDYARLRACFLRTNLSPGGIGSVNGSRLPINRKRLAELLGFDGVVHHTRDAMWQADMPIEASSNAVTLLINLSRLAEDLQIWTTQEFNLVELDCGYSRNSVIMPQKKNPYSLNYIRGLTNVTIGHLVAMANVGRTPSGQPDNRIFAYGVVPRLIDKTLEAVQLMAGVLNTLKVNTSNMTRTMKLGYSQATDLAEVIMLAVGLPYLTAHKVVQHVLRTAIERDIPADQISVKMIEKAGKEVVGDKVTISPETLKKALSPQEIINTRNGIGCVGTEPMKEMIAQCRERAAEIQTWVDETEYRLTIAEVKLISLVKKMINSSQNKDKEIEGASKT